MSGFEGIGKIIIIAGIIMVILGVILIFSDRIPLLGKLPGDIVIRKDGVTFYFPVVSLLLLSVVLTLIINFIWRLIGK